MNLRRSRAARTAVSVTALALLLGPSAAGAWAQEEPTPEATPEAVTTSEDPAATAEEDGKHDPKTPKDNTFSLGQSMQIRVNADAEPNSSLMNFRWSVAQLTVQGPPDGSKDGSVEVPVPEGGDLPRYLDNFGKPPVENGVATWTVDVTNGVGLQRTVSLFPQDAEPKIALKAEFTLDGEPITATDLVGKSGVVQATYTLTNKTTAPYDVTVKDLSGADVTKTVEGDAPMVAIAKTLLPQRYNGLNTGSGIFGADGRGNNQVQWIALPFRPLSDDGTASFGWAAHVTNAVIPSMLIQISPLYIPPADDPATPEDESATSGGGSPVNLDPAVAEIQAGLGQVIAGIEGLTAEDPNAVDPLDTLEAKLNSFFATLGTDLNTVVTTLTPTIDLLGQVGGLLTQIQGPLNNANENWDALVEKLIGLEALLNPLTCKAVGSVPDSQLTEAQCNELDALLKNQILPNADRLGGQISVVAPLINQLTPLVSGLEQALIGIQGKLQTIATGLQPVDLPTTDAIIASITASLLANPYVIQAQAGLQQVGAGVAMAQAELTAFVAEAIAKAQALAGGANEAIVNLRGSIAGLKAAAGQSPLIYGPLPAGTPPGTVLAGAYEFRIDAADTNAPYTIWRILVGLLLIIAAIVVARVVQQRRSS